MVVFGEKPLQRVLDERLAFMQRTIHEEVGDYVLNVNETEYVSHLIDRFRIEPVVFDWAGKSAVSREEWIPVERFPQDFVRLKLASGMQHQRWVYTYRIAYSGERELLRCGDCTWRLWPLNMRLDGDTLCFDVVNWRDNPAEMGGEATGVISRLQQQESRIRAEVDRFNEQLEQAVRQAVQKRKADLLRQANIVAALGVPISKSIHVPQTFAVPITTTSFKVIGMIGSVRVGRQHHADDSDSGGLAVA